MPTVNGSSVVPRKARFLIVKIEERESLDQCVRGREGMEQIIQGGRFETSEVHFLKLFNV